MVSGVCLVALKRRQWREFGRLLRMALVAYRLPRVFSHGDLHPQNVLIQNSTGAPVLIDWDHAGMLPVGCDLARLLLSVPPRLAESWIEAAQERKGGPRPDAMLLGWLIMTYFAMSQRHSEFHDTEAGRHLHRRFAELSSRRRPGVGGVFHEN
ncbi:aminoglycoside phosphotransferase family protein [Salinicola corii]